MCYATFIVWLYIRQPQTLAEVTGGLTATVGAYRINQQAFDDGLELFRRDAASRRRARRSSAPIPPDRTRARSSTLPTPTIDQVGAACIRTMSFSRRGSRMRTKPSRWRPDGRLVVDDPELHMHNADELRAELAAGLRVEASDFNPDARIQATQMKAATEAVYLPLLFLTVALLGGLEGRRPSDVRAAAAVRPCAWA